MRRIATILVIAILMTSTFVAAYTVALGQPFPRHLPIGVVGAPSPKLLAKLQGGQHEFDLHSYPSRAAAVEDIDRQKITAVVDANVAPPQLLLSSASSSSSARVLTQIDQPVPQRFALQIVDLHPLPSSDPAGLATFYLVIAATILGFVSMFQLRANVETLTLGRWMACIARLAIVGAAALTAVGGEECQPQGAIRSASDSARLPARIGAELISGGTVRVEVRTPPLPVGPALPAAAGTPGRRGTCPHLSRTTT